MNPECASIRPLISDYFDGETTESNTRLVRQHLEGCPDCQAALAAYQAIRVQFNQIGHTSAPLDLRRAVLAQVHATRTTRASNLRSNLEYGVLLGGILTVMLVIALFVVILTTGNSNTGAQVASVVASADGGTMVTFSQPINAEDIKKNLQVTDATGRTIETDVRKVSDKTIELKPKLGESPAPDKPLNVTVNKGGAVQTPQQFTVAQLPPTLTVVPATATTRPAQATLVPTTAAVSSATSITVPVSTTLPVRTTVTVVIPVTTTTAPLITPTVTTGVTLTVTITPSVSVTLTATSAVTATATLTTTTTVTLVPTTTVTLIPTTTVTATATFTPTVTLPVSTTATLTGVGCKIVPVSGFGKVYNQQLNLPQRLGCPLEQERQVTLAYQSFTNGFMLYDQLTSRIFVFYPSGRVETYKNSFQDGDPTPDSPSTCKVQSGRGFGKLWFSMSAVSQGLGCPLAPENSNALSATQNYEQGVLFFYPNASNGRRIYVVLANGTYLDLADVG
ncbi:MAG: zf-HC2 domain-containing protein [Chloroflexota bacterium]|nr:zf-HC2 domain-containing protein [Chloroflexota bacterium]